MWSPLFAVKVHMSMSPDVMAPEWLRPFVRAPPWSPADSVNAPGAFASVRT